VNLYGKVIVLILALFVCGGALNYVVQRQVVLPSFEALEQDLARTDVERVNRAIDTELQPAAGVLRRLGQLARDLRVHGGRQPGLHRGEHDARDARGRGPRPRRLSRRRRPLPVAHGRNPETGADRVYGLFAAAALDAGHPFRPAIAEDARSRASR